LGSDDVTWRINRHIGFAEGGYDAIAPALGGTQVDEEHLVVVMVDDSGDFGAAADEVAGRELALEDGVLEMVAVPAHGFEDFAETLVVADVVANEIGLSHRPTPY